ncbi:glycosyltransferase [Butyrivibrio sp. AE2032]|uniref:glycosyltransferase n=1 Tax=Butyrivibrio sp. AE2032 TaxID=1458463 RepID=UPI000556F497|nr:glycosyltransferase [Butyrivibrio sp. AE2032]
MKKPFFTIIVVSYNAGDKLIKTVQSIADQSFTDYRVLVKDGMSTDGSIDKLKETFDVGIAQEDIEKKITLLESCDNGIYHAMNIATAFLSEKIKQGRATKEDVEESGDVKILKAGEEPSYVFFLNCGDYFRDKNVLKEVHRIIIGRNLKEGTTLPAIYYGDTFDSSTGTKVSSNPKIDDHACYRNVPSHQACFYDERLIYRNPFDLKYKVRADYEQFLRCFYKEKAETVYMPLVIADYEGGGYSDQNKKISEEERRQIIKMYLPASKVRKYDFLRLITLSHFRTALASNRVTAGAYNGVKNAIYALKGRKDNKE